MSRRTTTDDERTLFRKSVDNSRPKVVATAKARKPVTAKAGGSGLDGNTAEKLKRGKLSPGARMDLHGLTEDGAHHALLNFLQRAQKDGIKLALVITGKGNPVQEEGAAWTMRRHGVLKEMVPRWLNEKSFAPLIAGSGPAHRSHGGDGALYIYLRKLR
jgi:DNA-nicking Smr family endonuclease